MIENNRSYGRDDPTKSPKLIYIYCEGAKREFQYFRFFQKTESRIHVKKHPKNDDENNSPTGLYKTAEKDSFQENDEVWIVCDTDPDKTNSRSRQIAKVRGKCNKRPGWNITESNPCFEVWLYCHHKDATKQVSSSKDYRLCSKWKKLLTELYPAGFDSRKNSIENMERATKYSERNFKSGCKNPSIGSTEVYKLGNSILSILNEKSA